MKIILESERLIFREFTPEDAPLVYQLNSDPEVVKYVHELPVTDLASALYNINNSLIFQYQQRGYGRWAVHLKDTNEFIGWCGLKYRPERNEVDLGYRFIRFAWGNGYATEASRAVIKYGFETLHLPEITAIAHIDNTASLKVIEKCGMQFSRFEEVEGCPVKSFYLKSL